MAFGLLNFSDGFLSVIFERVSIFGIFGAELTRFSVGHVPEVFPKVIVVFFHLLLFIISVLADFFDLFGCFLLATTFIVKLVGVSF